MSQGGGFGRALGFNSWLASLACDFFDRSFQFGIIGLSYIRFKNRGQARRLSRCSEGAEGGEGYRDPLSLGALIDAS